MNGYVEINGQKFLWIGKRSQMKPTYPGRLDHLVAGGLVRGCQLYLLLLNIHVLLLNDYQLEFVQLIFPGFVDFYQSLIFVG